MKNKNMDKKIISKCCGVEAEKPAEWNNYLYFCPKCHKNCEVIEEPQPIQKEEVKN